MSLMRWHGRRSMPSVFDEVDRMFGNLLRAPWPTARLEVDFGPSVDVYEQENEVVVKAELPGAKKEDIEIHAEDDMLTLRGETKQEEEVQEEGYHRKEIRRGSFYRQIPLPAAIDENQVTAKFEDGVLTVRAPKAEVKAGKNVSIE